MFCSFCFSFQWKGVHRVAVGIGKKIKQEELETIAGSPGRVVTADSFEELDKQVDNIRETTCSEFTLTFEIKIAAQLIAL